MPEDHLQTATTPPLSPVLLAGLALRPVPPRFFNPPVKAVLALMVKRHPGVFERLRVLGGKQICIEPTDLPFAFMLSLGSRPPVITVVGKTVDHLGAVAVVRGALSDLVDLLEGRVDGDALFFSRDLTIEGDTEAILTLRNALDSDHIDIGEDFLSALGPLSGPGRKALDVAMAIYRRASRDLELVARSGTKSLAERQQAEQAAVARLNETVTDLKKRMPKKSKSRSSPFTDRAPYPQGEPPK